MNKIYGYARVSTEKQLIERQEDNILKHYPSAKVYKEKLSGATNTEDRTQWNKLYSIVKPNDTIVFDEVSRLSRNAEDGFKVYMDLYNKGVNLVFLKEPHLNTSVYKENAKPQIQLLGSKEDILLKAFNEYLLEVAKEQIKIAFQQAENERKLLSQRTKDGIRKARQKAEQQGKEFTIGRKQGYTLTTKKEKEVKPNILKLSMDFNGNSTDKEVMEYLGISRNTYYKYKRQLKADN